MSSHTTQENIKQVLFLLHLQGLRLDSRERRIADLEDKLDKEKKENDDLRGALRQQWQITDRLMEDLKKRKTDLRHPDRGAGPGRP